MKQGVDELNKTRQGQERQSIGDWLSSADHSVQHNDFINRRQEGTGQWLLDSLEYTSWRSGSTSTLFCPGIPGAGKTMMTAIVVDDLMNRFLVDESVGIAFLYCNYKRQQEQQDVDLLASLLKQLYFSSHDSSDDVRSLYQKHTSTMTRPSFQEMLNLLRSLEKRYSRVIYVIDALDECAVDARQQLLSKICPSENQNRISTMVSLFATSRLLPEILERFKQCKRLDIRASDGDLEKYLDGRLQNFPKCAIPPKRDALGKLKIDIKAEIKTGIMTAVDGMFVVLKFPTSSLTMLTYSQVSSCATQP